MDYLYISEPIGDPQGFSVGFLQKMLDNGYMYPKSILPVSYVVFISYMVGKSYCNFWEKFFLEFAYFMLFIF